MPAPPRPDSIATEPENSESVPPETETLEKAENETTKLHSLLALPQRTSNQGLQVFQEDDILSIVCAFLWWFLFVLARVLSIAVFFKFFPIHFAVVLGIHYMAMLAYLFYYSKYFDLASFFLNFWLGLIYIFCIIEYRIKFNHADKWLITYHTFVIVQNAGMSLCWYLTADWQNSSTFLTMFTLKSIFYAIFASMAMCVVSLGIYYVVLKPRRRKIYVT